jgi:two-component sensor histidine kinase
MRELNHRTKNLLTVIRSIAGQLARTGKDLDDFKDRFNNRLTALASAHDVLVESNWIGASLADLVHSQFSQFHDLSGGQIIATGPAIKLSPRAAQAIGMGLYELMTNAVKYGALSSPDGRILVTWDIQEDAQTPMFLMEWREHGGPMVAPPRHRGFGHIVIADMTARSLFGDVDYRFESDGVVWKFKAPLENVREESEQQETQAA